jgi:hypothetical protein
MTEQALFEEQEESMDFGGGASEGFSLNPEMVQRILSVAKPLGHNEMPERLNLGFGFIYYGLVRAVRPKHVLVIGSGFGFSVVCLALGLKDNGEGFLTFVDPGYDVLKDGPWKTVGGRGVWRDAEGVERHFAGFGLESIIRHYRLRSEEFFAGYKEFKLPGIDLGFVDGNHSFEHVKHDFVQVLEHSGKNTYILMHDSNIYIRELIRNSGVKRWLNVVKKEKDCFELLDLPFSSGVAIIRVIKENPWRSLELSE